MAGLTLGAFILDAPTGWIVFGFTLAHMLNLASNWWGRVPEGKLKDVKRACKWRFPSRCWFCGYDLTGNESGQCPECGQKADE